MVLGNNLASLFLQVRLCNACLPCKGKMETEKMVSAKQVKNLLSKVSANGLVLMKVIWKVLHICLITVA